MADADADLRPADDVVRRCSATASASTSRSRSGAAPRSSRPTGAADLQRAALRRGPVHRRHPDSPTSGASGSRCRCCATSGPSCRSASCSRIVAERAGLAADSTAEPGAEPGLDVAPADAAARADRVRRPCGLGAAGAASPVRTAARDRDGARCRSRRRSSCRPSWRSTPTSPAGSSPSSSAASSSQAGFERAVLGLSGGIDSALVAYLVAEAIGAERLLAVLMPYRTSSPASRADAEAVVAALGCASELVDISPMVDGYFGTESTPGAGGTRGLTATPLRRGNFAARMRMAVLYDRSVTWGGLVVGTGNKTESLIGYTTLFGDSACAFNPIGDLYKSQVRQLAVAIGVPGRDRPQGAVGRPVARPDRRDRGRVQLPGPRPAAVLADRQAAIDRGDGRARLRTRRWSSGSTGWSPAPNSSARSRRSPSSGRGRPASTTSTRAGGRGRRAGDGRGVRGGPESRTARAACCTSSPRRSGTSAT